MEGERERSRATAAARGESVFIPAQGSRQPPRSGAVHHPRRRLVNPIKLRVGMCEYFGKFSAPPSHPSRFDSDPRAARVARVSGAPETRLETARDRSSSIVDFYYFERHKLASEGWGGVAVPKSNDYIYMTLTRQTPPGRRRYSCYTLRN